MKQDLPSVAITDKGLLYIKADNEVYIKTFMTMDASVFNLRDDKEYALDDLSAHRCENRLIELSHSEFNDIMRLVFEAYAYKGGEHD
jgi:hypothetical protein